MTGDTRPKYQRLKDYLIRNIKSNKITPGERIQSENQLAEEFEVSRHTVRQAIGELVSEGLLYRRQGKGTFVRHQTSEKGGQARTVGVITTYLNDYIFPSIIRGIDQVLNKNGYNIILGCTYNQHEGERRCLESLIDQGAAGLIVEPTQSALPNPNLDLYQKLKDNGVPILFIHGQYNELNSSFVIIDDMQAAWSATKHLIDLGHTRIGGIFKVDDIQGHCRFAGFHKAYTEAGHSLTDSRVVWFGTREMDEKFRVEASGEMTALLTECTAIVAYNDIIALKIMDAARSRGISIPQDISLVSFDDSQLATASEIKLTTVAHPKEKLGEKAGHAILDLIAQREKIYKVSLKSELIIRMSTSINEREVR